MANICDFSMVIRGKEADCENFLKALSRGSKEWIGDGAEIFDISTDRLEDEKVRMVFWEIVGGVLSLL